MNIVITGASKGIGFHTALVMAGREGTTVFAISRDEHGLRELGQLANLPGSAPKVVPYPFDLSSGKIEAVLLPAILEVMPRIDILVNNAGLMINKPFLEMEDEDLRMVFDSNFHHAALLIRALAPHMNRGSHIVNIGSMGGFQGSVKFRGLSVYSASKAALANLTECLAVEFSELDIKVNCLALGAANTEMLRQAFPGYQAPLSAEDMALFIADFALTGHHFFNGKVIPVSKSTP